MLCRNTLNNERKLDVWSLPETPRPQQRVVLLGASNLSRSFPIAVETARAMFPGPLAVYVAKGHGRSYGKESGFFGKKISGIFSCDLWQNFSKDNSLPTVACVTDIGNDLAYEVSVDAILDSVCRCFDLLQTANARVVVSDLPTDVLRAVGQSKYLLLRSLLFPQCRLSLCEMLNRADQLSERLREEAKSRKIACFPVPTEWYGLDPIHFRRPFFRRFWTEFFTLSGGAAHTSSGDALPWLVRSYLKRLRPEKWTWLGAARQAPQPNGRFQDGSLFSLY